MERSPPSQPKPLVDQEAVHGRESTKKGGWITLPFIAGSMLGLGLAINGTTTNLLVYLLKQYNVESIDAAQITNIVRGSLNLVPVAGAVVSDSYFGCFPVVLAGTAVTVLSFVLFTLTAALPSLRPPHCSTSPPAACQHATPGQLAVLYAAVCLLAVGTGGTRFNVAAMGADQFAGRDGQQDAFFNWYFVFLYASFVVGDTAVVYLQDGVSWSLGFAVCVATTATSLALLLLGRRYYVPPPPRGSPYTELARVIVAAARKARVDDAGPVRYYIGDGAVAADSDGDGAPSKRLRFLNRAAMITASDGGSSTDVSGAKNSRWRLCTVQQVEDLKSLLGVLPLWSSGILVNVSIGVMIGMVILQALAMDRSLGQHFKLPAGSITVSSMLAFIAATPVLERAAFPLWRRASGGSPPTPLQRVGLGHVVNVAGIVAAALVERRRLGLVDHGAAPMSALWARRAAGHRRRRRGAPLPGQHGLLLPGVPEISAEHGHRDGAAPHRARVLPQHRVRRRRQARHRLAPAQHRPGEARQRVLGRGGGGYRQFRVLPPLRQPVRDADWK